MVRCKRNVEVPMIPGDQVAQIAFTSGSTGQPQPHSRTWGSLVAGARFLGGHLGIARGEDYSILGTVPAQHVYGFDTTVMLSLQNGVPLHSGRPLLPADIAAALHDLPGRHWLATTPTHLRACVVEKTRLSGLAGVICATMPLAPELVEAVERMWATTIHEIYGCTEAGVVALRRPGRGERWRVTSGMRLWKKGEDTWVEGGHLEQALKVPDRNELAQRNRVHADGAARRPGQGRGQPRFPRGTHRELLLIPGVKDGCVLRTRLPVGTRRACRTGWSLPSSIRRPSLAPCANASTPRSCRVRCSLWTRCHAMRPASCRARVCLRWPRLLSRAASGARDAARDG